MKDRIEAYWNDSAHQQALIDAIGRLVAIKSVKGEAAPGAPYGPGPAAALNEALALCGELGFATRDYHRHLGLCDMGPEDIRLHILGHLDVVGEGKGWDTDPYVMAQRGDMLYGRGVSDDKGPLLCALFAMKAVRDLGVPLAGGVRLLLGTDEESGSEDVSYYYAREPFAPYAFTPDADFPVIHIEKGHYCPAFGRQWAQSATLPRVTALEGGFLRNVVPPEAWALVAGLTLADLEGPCADATAKTGATFTLAQEGECVKILCGGKNAHAAWPDDGNNAITALLGLLAELPLGACGSTEAIVALHSLFPHGDHRGKALGIAQADAESGPLTLNYALMTLTETGFTAQFDARVPICATDENCKAVCEATLGGHGMAVTEDGEMSAVHCVPADSPLVKTLLGCYSAYTGEVDPKPIAIGGGTYVHNIPGGVAFGCDFPGFDPKMHGANEQASVANLILSCKIFTQAIVDLCS